MKIQSFFQDPFNSLSENQKMIEDPTYDPAAICVLMKDQAKVLLKRYMKARSLEEQDNIRKEFGIPRSLCIYFTENESEKNLTKNQIWDKIIELKKISIFSEYKSHNFPIFDQDKERYGKFIKSCQDVKTNLNSIEINYDKEIKQYVAKSHIRENRCAGFTPVEALECYMNEAILPNLMS